MAGMAGFEPTHNGVKVRCLTAWRHPNFHCLYSITKKNNFVNTKKDCKQIYFVYSLIGIQEFLFSSIIFLLLLQYLLLKLLHIFE